MKPVTVTLKTVNITDGEAEQHETTAAGTYFYKNGTVIIKYTDTLYGDREEPVATSIKIAGNTATLTRTGLYESRIKIEPGKRNVCPYNTPYGAMLMGFTGEKLNCSFHENGGKLFTQYRVDVGGETVHLNQITVNVKEV